MPILEHLRKHSREKMKKKNRKNSRQHKNVNKVVVQVRVFRELNDLIQILIFIEMITFMLSL